MPGFFENFLKIILNISSNYKQAVFGVDYNEKPQIELTKKTKCIGHIIPNFEEQIRLNQIISKEIKLSIKLRSWLNNLLNQKQEDILNLWKP